MSIDIYNPSLPYLLTLLPQPMRMVLRTAIDQEFARHQQEREETLRQLMALPPPKKPNLMMMQAREAGVPLEAFQYNILPPRDAGMKPAMEEAHRRMSYEYGFLPGSGVRTGRFPPSEPPYQPHRLPEPTLTRHETRVNLEALDAPMMDDTRVMAAEEFARPDRADWTKKYVELARAGQPVPALAGTPPVEGVNDPKTIRQKIAEARRRNLEQQELENELRMRAMPLGRILRMGQVNPEGAKQVLEIQRRAALSRLLAGGGDAGAGDAGDGGGGGLFGGGLADLFGGGGAGLFGGGGAGLFGGDINKLFRHLWVMQELGLNPDQFLKVLGDVAVEQQKGGALLRVAGLNFAGTLAGHLTDLEKSRLTGNVDGMKAILEAIGSEKGVYGGVVNHLTQIGLSVINAYQEHAALAEQQARNAGLPEAEIAAIRNRLYREFVNRFDPIQRLLERAAGAALDQDALTNAIKRWNPGLLQLLQGLQQQEVPQPGLQQQAVPQPGLPQQEVPQPGLPQQEVPQPGLQQQNHQPQEKPPPEVQPVPADPRAPGPGQPFPRLDPEQIAQFRRLTLMLAGAPMDRQFNVPNLLPALQDAMPEWEYTINRYQRATDALEKLRGDSDKVDLDMLLKASKDAGLFHPQERAQWMVQVGAKYGLPKSEIVRGLSRLAGSYYATRDWYIARALLRALGSDLPEHDDLPLRKEWNVK